MSTFTFLSFDQRLNQQISSIFFRMYVLVRVSALRGMFPHMRRTSQWRSLTLRKKRSNIRVKSACSEYIYKAARARVPALSSLHPARTGIEIDLNHGHSSRSYLPSLTQVCRPPCLGRNLSVTTLSHSFHASGVGTATLW